MVKGINLFNLTYAIMAGMEATRGKDIVVLDDTDYDFIKQKEEKPKLSEEELEHIRSLPKKERKAYMKKLKG